jgi:sugar phosphate isomerase/epimerase
MNIEEASIQGAIQDNLPLISYVHAADSNRLYPGGGHTDVPAVLALLKEGGFSGEISAECLPLPDDGTAAYAMAAKYEGYLNAL